MSPGSRTVNIFRLVAEVRGRRDIGEILPFHFDFGDCLDHGRRDASFGGGNEAAFAVGEGDDGGAELNRFEGGILGDLWMFSQRLKTLGLAESAAYVTRAGDSDLLALEALGVAHVFHHVLNVVDCAVTRGFGTDEGTSPAACFVSASNHTP